MPHATLYAFSALVALLPATLFSLRRDRTRGAMFWLLLGVAIAGPSAWVWAQYAQGWRTGLAPTLWTAVAASLAVFAVAALAWREAWRLAPLLMPYLVLLALAALVWQSAPERPLVGAAPAAWIRLHIVSSVLTYALLTVCAIAGLATFLQERALKSKRQGALARLLPPLSEAEVMELRLLVVSAAVLGLGVVTGMATQFFEAGALLILDHKTLLSLATFAVILALLGLRRRTGLRGRRAARLVLLAYLLLTLAYPGVKFVTDVLLV